MTKKTIVTLSDSNYFPLLEELIHSIRRFKESEKINICVLDAGLTSAQVDKLSVLVNEIKKSKLFDFAKDAIPYFLLTNKKILSFNVGKVLTFDNKYLFQKNKKIYK